MPRVISAALQGAAADRFGSRFGLGSFASELTDATVIPYSQIPHFPLTGAEGHAAIWSSAAWAAFR